MTFLGSLHRVMAHESLTLEEARSAMLSILTGDASTAAIAAFLVALRMKGETADELTGFALAMRERSHRVDVGLNGEPLLDTCGTGGDGASTFNISTVAAFVIAGAGVRVAKHGNRSLSSRCGSADVLEALGVGVASTPADAARAIREIGIGFLFAPALHPAMKHAQPARLELKTRTVFNLLGPLTNPAGADRQLIGAPTVAAARLMAQALATLGTTHAFVVHGADGLDEVSTTGPTIVFDVVPGVVREREWTPAHFGVRRADIEELRGGDIECNRDIARTVLTGTSGAQRDIVLVNAAAALMAAGKADTELQALRLAAESIDSARAYEKLEALARFTSAATQPR
jgi:anthranilate phosphoribosyltransferase